MDSWEAPKLSDLKATPPPAKPATFDLLGEPQDSDEHLDLATQEATALGDPIDPAVLTERRVIGGQVVEVITSSPPPVRREVAPVSTTYEVPTTFAGLSLDEDALPETDDETDDGFFDAWTMEPATNRGIIPQIRSRGVAIGLGVAAIAVAGVLFVWLAADIATVAAEEPAEVAAAQITEAAANVAPALVEEAPEVVIDASVAEEPEDEPAPLVAAEHQAALKKSTKSKSVRRAAVPVPAETTLGQGWEEPQAKSPDRSTMYTPNAPQEPIEEPEAKPEPAPEPEAAPEPEVAPATTGTNPWGKPPKAEAKPEPKPTATNPWGAQ